MDNNVRLVNFLNMPYDLRLESFKWRTSPHVDKYFQLHNLTLDGHRRWLATMIGAQPRTVAFFIMYGDRPVGATFFQKIDWGAGTADWGIYIHDTTMRGHGIGSRALAQSLQYAQNEMKLHRVFLEVLSTNSAARRVYENAGFQKIAQRPDGVLQYVFDIKGKEKCHL